MSVTFAQTSASSSSNMFTAPSHVRRGSESTTTTPSWEKTQPIPWEQQGQKQLPAADNTNANTSNNMAAIASSSTEPHPPQIMVWRTSAASHHANVVEGGVVVHRSTGVSALGINTTASRSRVSMDALPVEGDGSPNPTISPSSSSASLPMMDEMTSPPPPRATAIQPAPFARPVGLGLSVVRDPHGNEWPSPNSRDEVDSDEDEMVDQNEMDNYMASHRAPVDATLRSMPGVVGLGDGWAGGPQNKPKKNGWFRRNKKEEVGPAEADPLALWAMPETPTSTTASTGMVHSPEIETAAVAPLHQQHQQQDGKWWTSTRNLFTASQRVLSPQPQPLLSSQHPPSSFPTSPTSSKTPSRGIRSKLTFGSMVDLRRNSEHRGLAFPPLDEPSSASSTSSAPRAPVPSKRHSVAAFLRKSPVHPLELTHGKGASPASKSQPYSLSASSSQPSLISPSSHHHPMLRQAYARSESYLAGAGADHGSPPRPAPLIINSGAFVNTGPLPTWRPPVMSPTPLLEVQEEDEEEHETPDANGLVLQRSATFGDEDDYSAQKDKVSTAPELSDISGSPLEGSRALSASTSFSSKADLAPPPQKFLHRLRSVLSLGRGRKTSSLAPNKSPKMPESPRSFQSEHVVPVIRHPEITASQLTNSIGRNTRRRSKLFSRRRDSAVEPLEMKSRPAIQVQNGQSPPTILSPASNSPMAKASPKFANDPIDTMRGFHDRASVHGTLGIGSGLGVGLGGGSLRGPRRTSWAAPLPPIDNTDDDDDDDVPVRRVEKRLSRVSLRRLTGQPKPRPPLGTVFPRPPTEMQAPPSLHWAFPASYSTPMLHKFGGSTLSLALDISAEGKAPTPDLDDIQESPTRREPTRERPSERRERAISATIAALTAGQTSLSPSNDSQMSLSRNTTSSTRARRTVPLNIENLNSSNDSLTLPTCNGIVDFPLPPSDSSGDISSPDPDHVEQLYTPREVPPYPQLPSSYYRRRTRMAAMDATDSGEESSAGSSSSRSKQRSWSTCKTSGETVGSGRATPLATPTSSTPEGDTRCSSYGSLITAMEGSEPSEVELTPRATTYAAKRLSVVSQQIVA